ncbi:PfkB family carbohydrate kinase, partial [Streptomyces sp. SID3212]|uniref:carbohydrate kinase family protein n=1 Tax=Streptomyces sp. SID3212 TaxID=2690259 RepID=UPI0013C6F081
RLRELCGLAGIVKASDEDVLRLWPGADPGETCRRLAGEGRLVVLTRGSRGATAYTRAGEPVTVPAVQVEVVNTIGAGDAFMAAVLNWLSREGEFARAGELSPAGAAEMLGFASRVAASVVAQEGTRPVPVPVS